VDILTIKYSPTGDTIWKAVYDDGGGDIGYDIEVDSLGFVYVAGVTHSNDYVTLKYDRIGNLLWSRVQPSQLIPWNPTLKLDKYRNIYMSYVSYRTGNYENYAVVKYNNDGVQQWIGEYNNGGSSINIIYDMALDKNANVFVTGRSGGSMATVKFVQTPTAINQATNNYPEEFKLEQNYPNPFNPTTNLEFGIPSVRGKSNLEFVSLKVYDVLGNEVSTLVNEKKNAGRYEVEFDGSNFPSGIYFYSLTVDGIVIDTKRMILLK
ncbi:MAG TPA: SBBP repeat-containing protein, partial [Ignavibacteria bacterium]|nr:SBBP repeat-containing protein [Ignavibacteria bacterium]